MFRSRYLDYSELSAQCAAWAQAHPGFVTLSALGKSREGRDIPLLTIGPNPQQARPAVWVDGNMHASEFCGSSAALAIAEDLIAIHAGRKDVAGLPAHLIEALKSVLFYIVPRISPDGAEAALKTGRYVRSHPADHRANRGRSYWQNADIDGDGQMGYMRQHCADGEMTELTDESGKPLDPPVLVPRRPEDAGPFWRVYPEGYIVNFDGAHIPTPDYLCDTQTDFNRNFPYQWGSEDVQRGSGEFPGSEPETRAILEFVSAHPNIVTWANYHTFGGVFLRPLGDKPDHEMDPGDLAAYKEVEQIAKTHTGYPTVSGYHEFQYEPGVPVRGILTDYAYHQRGCLAFGVELWDIFQQIGVEPRKRFIDLYTTLTR
ncbi:MAG TPA: M14 family metallopeptidase, partial [Usitatibacteraceae bacterium]|nr:M14 family metallopeptidase [Usitatibacteraceae bacterium]